MSGARLIWGVTRKGGQGSGNFGHAGRPGKRGGSAPRDGMGAGTANLPGGRDLFAFDGNDLDAIEKRLAKTGKDFLDYDDLPGKRWKTDTSTPVIYAGSLNSYMNGKLEYGEWSDGRVDCYGAGEPWATAGNHARAGLKKRSIRALSKATGVDEETVDAMLKSWASTSNGNSLRSLQMQADIAAEMGVELSDWQKQRLEQAQRFSQEALSVYDSLIDEVPRGAQAIREFAVKHEVDVGTVNGAADYLVRSRYPDRFDNEEIHTLQYMMTWGARDRFVDYVTPLDSAKVRRVARAIYDRTQKALSRYGRHAFYGEAKYTLFRGVDYVDNPPKRAGERMRYRGNALESWSVGARVGHGFGKFHLAVRVPRERVFCTARTGMGCLSEGEVILFGMNDVEVAAF